MSLIILLVMSLSMYIVNAKAGSTDATVENKGFSILFGFTLFIALVVDVVIYTLNIKLPAITYLAVGIGAIVLMIFLNTEREKQIEKKHKEIKEVLSCLVPVTRQREIPDNLEAASEQFDLDYDKSGNLNKIVCQIDDIDKWNDNALTKVVMNLNKFLNNKRWTSSINLERLECTFSGEKLPPRMAAYPGSFLRPDNLIPVGVTSSAEVSLNINLSSKKECGDSVFFFEPEEGKKDDDEESVFDAIEHGVNKLIGTEKREKKGKGTEGEDIKERAETMIPPRTPQMLVAGSTGGGKAIFVGQSIFIEDRV